MKRILPMTFLTLQGTQYLSHGVAPVKALVIGKFILIGEAIKVGERSSGPTLLHRITWKTLAFLLMLRVFTIIEEIVVGWVHGQGVGHDKFRALLVGRA